MSELFETKLKLINYTEDIEIQQELKKLPGEKLARKSVTDDKLRGVASIADNTITAAMIQSNAITTAKLASQAVTYAKIQLFISTEQTGNGGSQSIAHGLGATPSKVFIIPTDLNPATTGDFTVTEGTHTSTNVVVTVTNGKKYKVFAIV